MSNKAKSKGNIQENGKENRMYERVGDAIHHT